MKIEQANSAHGTGGLVARNAFRRVAVFGAGASGRALVRWLIAGGGEVRLLDDKADLAQRDLPSDFAAAFDAFVFSPGIPPGHRWRRQVAAAVAAERIFGDVGFALCNWPGRCLGVTGTNGKTTVTLLLEAFLRASVSGRVTACGNIGKPCAEAVLECAHATSDDWLVVEISSFQAFNSNGIRLDGLIWTNFAPDHIDWHGSEDAYFAAKAGLLGCLKPNAPVLVDAALAARLPGSVAATVDGRLAGADPDADEVDPPWLPEAFQRLPQRSNWQQVRHLLSALGCLPTAEVCARVLQDFVFPPHRLHALATVRGVCYWNDSKATNPHAALAALSGFKQPLLWLAGGRDKGIDMDVFARDALALLAEGSRVITFGEVGSALALALREHGAAVELHADARTLVPVAQRLAKEFGLTAVVFSPGFASFDGFSSYAERGKNFILQVLCLKDAEHLA